MTVRPNWIKLKSTRQDEFRALLPPLGSWRLMLGSELPSVFPPGYRDKIGFERDASGSYSIYDRNGQRVGVGKPRSDGSIDLYDAGGRRDLEVRPERPRRK